MHKPKVNKPLAQTPGPKGKNTKKSQKATGKPFSPYIDYDPSTGRYSVVPGRPNNQNTAKVVKKTAANIANKIPLSQRMDTTRIFVDDVAKKKKLSEMNSGAGLQMAHVRSSDEWKHTLVEVLNAPLSQSLTPAKKKKVAPTFQDTAMGYISSDAEGEDRKRVRKSALVMTDPKAAPKKRAEAATFLFKRFNGASRMLVGADPHTNMVIKSRQDRPTQKNGKVFADADKRSKLLDALQDHLGMPHEKILKEKGKPLTSTMNYP